MMKEDIMLQAIQQFMQFGIRSVTMSDIATNMGISKKTLYTHFEDKAALVHEVMRQHLQTQKETFESFRREYPNPIEYFLRFCQFHNTMIRSLNPSTSLDLQKYYGSTWQLFNDHKNNFIFKSIKSNLEEGIEQGLYRDDFNPDIIAKLYIGRMEVILDQKLFPIGSYKISDIHYEFVMHHLNGLLTEKGRKYLKQSQQKEMIS